MKDSKSKAKFKIASIANKGVDYVCLIKLRNKSELTDSVVHVGTAYRDCKGQLKHLDVAYVGQHMSVYSLRDS